MKELNNILAIDLEAPPRAGRRIGAAAYDAKAKEMFDLGRQSRKR